MRSRTAVRQVLAVFGVWFVATLAAVLGGAYAAAPGEPSVALVVQLVAVVAAYHVVMRVVPSLRRGVEALDPALLVGLQSWRVLGMMFLFLMALGELPAVFSVPAGVGDVLVGVTAPFVAVKLRNGSLPERALGAFVILGLLDFVAAFAFGNVFSVQPDRYAGFASMTQWPMVLVPGLFVPAFALLHLASWTAFRARQAGTEASDARGVRHAA